MRKLFFSFLALLLLAGLFYNLPPIHARLAWRVDEQVLKARYRLHPPEEVVFVPREQAAATLPPPQMVVLSPTLSTGGDIPVPARPEGAAPGNRESTPSNAGGLPTELPAATSEPTPPAEPLPPKASLSGVRYEDQHGRWNYCAPSTLAMALSFWGWQGDRDTVGPILKPDPKDKNVMPYEMAAYVQERTALKADLRLAGDLDLLKRLLAGGFPVLVEKGTYLTDLTGVKSWMGHYEVVTGYDDGASEFVTQDSFTGADFKVSYEAMEKSWRAFNYTYLLIYPAEKEAEVHSLLGSDADETANFQHAAQKASEEIYTSSGIDLFFAWYNRGSSLVELQDYAGAASAFDQAFAVYPTLTDKERPWRMLWYQTGPYFAYYYSGRYYDVLDLADKTLEAMQSDKNLEETYYWRGMAKAALGDSSGAAVDYQTSLQYHTGFGPAVYQLKLLGIEN